jgi:hypothetical protein
MRVIFHGMHWIQHWSLLQKEEDRPQIKSRCRVLEMVTMEFLLQMDGILAIKFRFNSMTLLFVSQLFTISLFSSNTEVWLVIMDSYMHWSMQRLEY